jgi:hypothetical protein
MSLDEVVTGISCKELISKRTLMSGEGRRLVHSSRLARPCVCCAKPTVWSRNRVAALRDYYGDRQVACGGFGARHLSSNIIFTSNDS